MCATARHGVITLVTICVACSGEDGVAPGSVAGMVTDASGTPIAGARITAAGEAVTTGATGAYLIASIPPGRGIAVSAGADWFVSHETTVNVVSGQTANADFSLSARALQVEAADLALAEAYNASFDWTTDIVSIAHVPRATQAQLELAIHYRNPALYRDTSGQTQWTPDPLPSIANPAEFDFPVAAAGGAQAFDAIVDNRASIGLTQAEINDVCLWTPVIEHLVNDWDFQATSGLRNVGLTVEEQRWGGPNTLPTQRLEQVYLHGGQIWVAMVFEDFLALDPDVTDSDADGVREIYARVNSAHYASELYDELLGSYITPTHTVPELRDRVIHNLDVLYYRSNPTIVSTLGVPYSHAHLGHVAYPFVVIEHQSVGTINVLLVEP